MNTASNRATVAQIKIIHVAKAKLGMLDEEYRGLLERVAGVRSAKHLTFRQAGAVIDEFKRLGFGAPVKADYPGRPKAIDSEDNDRGRMLSKIEALLTEAGRPWSYADGMAKRICRVDRIAWAKPEGLHKIIAALMYDAKRHGRYTGR